MAAGAILNLGLQWYMRVVSFRPETPFRQWLPRLRWALIASLIAVMALFDTADIAAQSATSAALRCYVRGCVAGITAAAFYVFGMSLRRSLRKADITTMRMTYRDNVVHRFSAVTLAGVTLFALRGIALILIGRVVYSSFDANANAAIVGVHYIVFDAVGLTCLLLLFRPQKGSAAPPAVRRFVPMDTARDLLQHPLSDDSAADSG